MCSDSTKIEDVEKLMNGEKADMVFTDPPYGVNYAKKNEFLNTISPANRIQKDIENDTMSLDETSDFICQCFVNLRLSLAEKSSYYITAPQGGDLLLMMMKTMQKADIPLRHMLIWVKNNHVLGRTDYNYKHEPILFGWVNTHNFYGKGEFKFSTWEIDKPLKNDLHPTMKPVALIVNACLNSTLEGDKVLDLFGGSGSTLIACEQTNRKCYIMELDERYATIILDRWEKLTGKKGEKTNGE
jgi:site-specific DNA-methyltransferase (adenine-specific)